MVHTVISVLSGEFILRWLNHNGGTAVFLRSVYVATLLFISSIALESYLVDSATLHFDLVMLFNCIRNRLSWFGLIFAGAYVALYARFSAQWHYLADLYNQMMATAVSHPPSSRCKKLSSGMLVSDRSTNILRLWQAGFIEDADDLHLASKPMFASVIRALLERDQVRQAFTMYAPGGKRRLSDIEARIEKSLARVDKKWAAK
jgi:hypothetical protein